SFYNMSSNSIQPTTILNNLIEYDKTAKIFYDSLNQIFQEQVNTCTLQESAKQNKDQIKNPLIIKSK
ncbi:20142_t:CDS:2, partial [Cetraspora pellucida]